MTTIAFDAVLGPHGIGNMLPYGGWMQDDYYSLDDANDAIAWKFVIPSNGTVTEIGFFVPNRLGSPSAYQAGLLMVSTASGFPSLVHPYGGSSVEYTNPPVGWNWITLSTPATVSTGDLAALTVFPTSSGTYNTSNYVSINTSPLFSYDASVIPTVLYYTTAWLIETGRYGAFAVKYNDGTVYGLPLVYLPYTVINTESTPDEVGCKFTVPCDVNCVGPSISVLDTNTSEKALKITLYDSGGNELRSITFLDSDELFMTRTTYDGYKKPLRWDTPVALAPNITYRLTFQNLTSTSGIGIFGAQFYDLDSKNNNYFANIRDWSSTVRTNSGVWTDNDLVVYDMGIIVDSITVATSGVTVSSAGGSYAYVG